MPTTTIPETRFRTIDGLRIRYAESTGAQGPTLLLTSPWPESVYAIAPMWPTLAEHARLFAAAAHPERIAGAIVGTGGAAVPLQLGDPLKSWVLDPDLDKYRRMDPRAIVNVAVDTIAGGIPDEIRQDYQDCYAGDRFAESMRYVRRYPQELPELAELLPHIATPVTIINGRDDRVVPVANAEFLDARLPNSRVAIIDAGHFVWEEAPVEYAVAVLDAIARGQA